MNKRQKLGGKNKKIAKKIMLVAIYTYVLYNIVAAMTLLLGTIMNFDILDNVYMVLLYSILIVITGFLFLFRCFKIELLFIFMVLVQILF